MAYPYDQGATVYLSKADYEDLKNNGDDATKELIAQEETWSAEAEALGLPSMAGPAFGAANDRVYKYLPYTKSAEKLTLTANKAEFLKSIVENAYTAGYRVPTPYYFAVIDDFVLKASTIATFSEFSSVADWDTKMADVSFSNKVADIYVGSEANHPDDFFCVNPYVETDSKDTLTEISVKNSILRHWGSLKFTGVDNKLFGYFDQWNDVIRGYADKGFSQLSVWGVPTSDFLDYYKSQMNAKIAQNRSCIATRVDETGYGHYGTRADWRVAIEQKDWGYAWGKGFLEGLLVFPVTWLLDTLAYSFDASLSGFGQIWALVIVTLIVRGLLLLISFRSTMDSQKMQALQPEIQKLQAKYPNANTNQAEKQRLSQEQMALYRRHNIKPFRQILLMIVQFPVFICVWAGLQGSAALSTGEFLNMRLSDNINSILFNVSGTWYYNTTGWWTALILFLLMAATQLMAMLLPRILAKRASKNVVKTSKNPAQDQQGKTMKYVTYGMIIFTIIMGFFLPSAMGIYWLIGGLISMAQTFITQTIMAKARKGKR